MADPYVIFPGTDSFLSTEDTNLLDADTAHVYQSQPWVGSNATVSDNGLLPSGFGSVLVTTTVDGALLRRIGLSVSFADGEHTSTVLVDNKQDANRDVIITILTTSGNYQQTAVTVGPGVHRVSMVRDYAAGDITEYRVQFADSVVGDEFVCSEFSFSEGSGVSFTPSLRIVGDLDVEVIAATPSVAAGGYLIGQWFTGQSFRVLDAGGKMQFSVNVGGSFVDSVSDWPQSRVTLRFTRETDGWLRTYINGSLDAEALKTSGALPVAGQELLVGARSATLSSWAGDIYSATLRDGIDGPVVAEFLATDVPVAAQLPA